VSVDEISLVVAMFISGMATGGMLLAILWPR
jgi:hypothetical protein